MALEVKQPGRRLTAFWDGTKEGSGTGPPVLQRGMMVTMNGKASADLGLNLNYAGVHTPRFARTGDPLVTIAATGWSTARQVFPVNKILFKREDADLTSDTITSGEYLILYDGGEYETDRYGTIHINADYGWPLYVDANGKLTTVTGSPNNRPVAIFISSGASFDSDYHAASMIWFRMIPSTLHGNS